MPPGPQWLLCSWFLLLSLYWYLLYGSCLLCQEPYPVQFASYIFLLGRRPDFMAAADVGRLPATPVGHDRTLSRSSGRLAFKQLTELISLA
jgi:hypothetical protein